MRVHSKAIQRFGVAGRYAPEFEAVGNDHAAMEELARRTGGRVISAGDNGRIDIQWPVERVGLESECAVAGAAILLGGLWRWRRS